MTELGIKKLFINTSSNIETFVSLTVDGKKYKKVKRYDKNRSQVVLPMIVELLSEHDLAIIDITAVELESGPGSFTGLRVGAAVANTLGYFLKIPINNNPPGTLVDPVYT